MSAAGVFIKILVFFTAVLLVVFIWITGQSVKRDRILRTVAIGFAAALLISFVDITPPVISQRQNRFSYTAHLGIDTIVTCYDNADSFPKISFVSSSDRGVKYNKKEDAFLFPGTGKYTLTFEASDKYGNVRTKSLAVHIVDDIPPMINTGQELIEIPVARDEAARQRGVAILREKLLSDIYAYDEKDRDVSGTLSVDDAAVDYTSPGFYDSVISAHDSSDNISEIIVKVKITDTDAARQTSVRPH